MLGDGQSIFLIYRIKPSVRHGTAANASSRLDRRCCMIMGESSLGGSERPFSESTVNAYSYSCMK